MSSTDRGVAWRGQENREQRAEDRESAVEDATPFDAGDCLVWADDQTLGWPLGNGPHSAVGSEEFLSTRGGGPRAEGRLKGLWR
ncbi:hypothetical protein VCV18_009678 [Metarhizium anisopliae]